MDDGDECIIKTNIDKIDFREVEGIFGKEKQEIRYTAHCTKLESAELNRRNSLLLAELNQFLKIQQYVIETNQHPLFLEVYQKKPH